MTLAALMRQLETKPMAMPWLERRALVPRAMEGLRLGSEGAPAERLLVLLAQDSKWEVRKAVADQMLEATDSLYEQLVLVLANDPNSFVAQSVQREMGRRSLQTSVEKRHKPKPIKRLITEIQSRYGDEGVQLATKFSEKVTEQVIRTAVHDIKGILTPIKPYLEGLRSGVAEKGSKRRVERILDSVEYLERMLSDMRQWADDIELAMVEEDIVAVLERAAQDACDHLHGQCRNPAAVVVRIDNDARPILSISRPQFQMAFTNLVKNGIEAHAISSSEFKPGVVTITVAAKEQVLQIDVVDTGKGMNAHDLEKLIEFVPGNTSKKHLGTGYGLPIAKRYIEAHRGKLIVTSVEGHGSTFTVLIPLEPSVV